MANERIVPAQKITAGGIQLGDLQNGELGYDEVLGLLVRKNNDGTAIQIIGRLNAVNLLDILTAHYTKTEVDNLITNAGGGDMLSTNNLSDLANASTARTNLDVRSTAQVTTEITNALATINLAALGGLNQTQVDARVVAGIAAEFSSAPAAYNTLQKIFAEMEEDDTDAAALLTQVDGKLDKGGVVGGRVIS